MISVMSEREIDRKSLSPADLSFFGVDGRLGDSRARDAASIAIPGGARVSPDPDPSSSFADAALDSDFEASAGAPVLESTAPASWGHEFRTGDMVWGKVKSHPWWPGQILNEAFATAAVRRTKREGYVLVAFFGDSSYGWFDPAELIPFEPYFSEKSKQTTLRPFVAAVEEAVDELSRRGALGLACCCRNPYSFRTTTTPGFLAVEVVGYEPRAVYSLKQIRNARDGFQPVDVLAFTQQLAVNPPDCDYDGSADFIRNIAMILAYRKSVFEEFDETYAQAFGIQPVRPEQSATNAATSLPDRFTPRAIPLSGSLKIAEFLGTAINRLPSAAADAPPRSAARGRPPGSKKNKYEFKRRDDAAAAPTPMAPLLATLSPPPTVQTQPPMAHGDDYILQKRPPLSPLSGGGDLEYNKFISDSMAVGPTSAPPSEMRNVFDTRGGMGNAAAVESKPDAGPAVPQLTTSHPEALFFDVGGAKEEKLPKRKRDDLPRRYSTSALETKKKKKSLVPGDGDRRKTSAEPHPAAGAPVDGRIEAVRRDDQMKGMQDASLLQVALPPPPMLDPISPDTDIADLLADLQVLALDPFYRHEASSPALVRHVFSKYRSLVYQKSLVLPAAGDMEAGGEFRTSKPRLPPQKGGAVSDEVLGIGREQGEQFRSALPMPPPRPIRPDDPTKAGRKRVVTDRQEELSEKRLKKQNKIAALAAAKKPELAPDKKVAVAAAPAQPSLKRHEAPVSAPAKVPSPTFLVMKFPPSSTLPSIPSLKAKFARFGPLDISGTRVYWKTFTCKVLYKFHADAMSAFAYVQSNDLFGQIKVGYSVREVESAAPDPIPDPLDASQQLLPSDGGHPQPLPPLRHSSIQLKSILKKPGEDGNGNGGAKESQRVKFRLGGEEDYKPPPPSAGVFVADGTAPLSSMPGIDSNLKPAVAFQRPPFTGHPSARPPVPFPHTTQHDQRPLPSNSTLYLPPSSLLLPPRPSEGQHREASNQGGSDGGVDISREMMGLLVRCNDIVTNLKATLGFLPYYSSST